MPGDPCCAQPVRLCDLVDCSHQAPLSMAFSRQEYWNGLPFPSPGDLPDPGIEPTARCLLHWQVDSLPLAPLGKAQVTPGAPLKPLWGLDGSNPPSPHHTHTAPNICSLSRNTQRQHLSYIHTVRTMPFTKLTITPFLEKE